MISVAACRRSPRLLSMAPIWQHLLVSHYSVTTATATAVLKPEKGIPAWVNVILFKSFAAKAQVQKLQEAIGYCFKAEQLLHTAMSLQERDHKPLAYLGDAALLMLFREEAFLIALRDHKPHNHLLLHMGTLLSGKHFTAVAVHRWKLHRIHMLYNSSSSSSSSSPMHVGLMADEHTLAEQFEAIVGAILLDSSYNTLRDTLQPWITATSNITQRFEAARQQQQQAVIEQQQRLQQPAAANPQQQQQQAPIKQQQVTWLHNIYDILCKTPWNWLTSTPNRTPQQHHKQKQRRKQKQQQQQVQLSQRQQQLASRLQSIKQSRLLLECLQQHLRTGAYPKAAAAADKKSLWSLLYNLQLWRWASQPQSQSHEQQSLPSKHIIEQLRAQCRHELNNTENVQRCARLMCAILAPGEAAQEHKQQALIWCGFGRELLRFAARYHSWRLHVGSSSSSSACHGGTARANKEVHKLMDLNRRANMFTWLGLYPALWCPESSSFHSLSQKQQAGIKSQWLSLLLTAVYLDGGMTAAIAVADVLLTRGARSRK